MIHVNCNMYYQKLKSLVGRINKFILYPSKLDSQNSFPEYTV